MESWRLDDDDDDVEFLGIVLFSADDKSLCASIYANLLVCFNEQQTNYKSLALDLFRRFELVISFA